MKKILILGGTRFIGRNLVERLLENEEYEITLFNRQQTNTGLFPDVIKIKGDRDTSDIEKISKIQWDYVIDLSCYYPDSLASVLKCLAGNAGKYIFISTCSVYDNTGYHGILRSEEAPILSCNDKERTSSSDATYGNRKAECERILQSSGIDYIILRPAMVYGAYDPTDRMYYWLYQAKNKKTLLLPDNGERKFSITYVRDLVEAILRSLTLKNSQSIYNVISFPQVSIIQIVSYAQEILGTDLKTVNASPEFLKKNDVRQWTDMPLWLDSDDFTYNNQKLVIDFDIPLCDFRKTLSETIAYYSLLNRNIPKYGMSEEKRLGLIEKVKNFC